MDPARPTIAVIIPAFNEAELLPRCLAAIMPQAKAIGAVVMVVDNHSTDRTAAVAREAGARVVREDRQGYVHALRAGVDATIADVVAFTDADTLVPEKWLDHIAGVMEVQSTVAVTGPVTFEGAPLVTLVRKLFSSTLWGANMAIRRSALDQVGGFDESINLYADLAIGKKIAPLGNILVDKRLRVRTSSRRFHAEPLRQSFHYVASYLWYRATQKPLFWHFDPIRTPHSILRRKVRTRTALVGIGGAFLVALYLLLWPSSTDFGQVVVRPRVNEKVVALTFDDGPNGAATRAIVDELVQAKATATFFEVGRSVQADPTTAKYVTDHGFLVEDHSWDHTFMLPLLHGTHLAAEFTRTMTAITSATGTTPTLFRPPHGFRSPQMFEQAHDLGLQMVDWSVDPKDYLTGNATTITNRVVNNVKPGSIVLLHDGLQDGPRASALRDRKGTITALPAIIQQLRARGYTFVTIPQLIAQSAADHPDQDRKTNT